MPVYLDCAATTPLAPPVEERVLHFLRDEFANAGSRTHEFGRRARRAVEHARDQVAAAVNATRGEVLFTSGATESNNLAILGLAGWGLSAGRKHIVSTQIEHHAVLEPLRALESRGFEVTLVGPTPGGWVDADAVAAAVRDDTLLVSVMQVNNETGIIQPVEEIAGRLAGHPAWLHVDAAQGFGHLNAALRHRRIDLISLSGHKIYAPKGVGAMVARKRDGQRPPLAPLMFGGGQELGLRPGTLPVHLIAGLGAAAELAEEESAARTRANLEFRHGLLRALSPLGPRIHGDPGRAVPHILNLSLAGIDGETAIEALAGEIAISTGAACTTQARTCSHVLSAMKLPEDALAGALRLSWCHMTPKVNWGNVVEILRRLLMQS